MSIVGGWAVHHFSFSLFASVFSSSFVCMGFSHSLRYAISIPFYILLLLNVNCFQILSDHWFSAVSIVGGWAVHHFSFSLFASVFFSFVICTGFSHSSRYAIPISFYILLLLNVNCLQNLSMVAVYVGGYGAGFDIVRLHCCWSCTLCHTCL